MRYLTLLLVTLVSISGSAHPVINEVMYDPDPYSDSYNEWVELYNPTDGPLDLSSYMLCDDTLKEGYVDKEDKEVYGAQGLSLKPKEYAIITDGGSGTSAITNYGMAGCLFVHTSKSSICGGLSNSGDTVTLVYNGAVVGTVSYPKGTKGNSYALSEGNWAEAEPTPCAPNTYTSLSTEPTPTSEPESEPESKPEPEPVSEPEPTPQTGGESPQPQINITYTKIHGGFVELNFLAQGLDEVKIYIENDTTLFSQPLTLKPDYNNTITIELDVPSGTELINARVVLESPDKKLREHIDIIRVAPIEPPTIAEPPEGELTLLGFDQYSGLILANLSFISDKNEHGRLYTYYYLKDTGNFTHINKSILQINRGPNFFQIKKAVVPGDARLKIKLLLENKTYESEVDILTLKTSETVSSHIPSDSVTSPESPPYTTPVTNIPNLLIHIFKALWRLFF